MNTPLRRYSVARFVVALAVLGSAIALVTSGAWDGGPDHVHFFRLSAVQLLLLIATTLWARTRPSGPRFLYLLFLLDVAGASMLSAWTGGAGSLLTFLYFPTIAAAAYLLGRTAALAVAGISTGGLLCVLLYAGAGEDLELAYWETGFRILSFFLVAILAGELAASLQRAGEALLAQKIASQTVLERVRAGVVTTSPDELVTGLNPSARLLLGDVEGQRLADIFRGSFHHRTWEETRPDGTRWVCSQANLPDGGRVVVIDDVSELWTMREHAQRDERYIAVGKLSAGLAHEIRNPLAALSGILQLLAEDRPSREIDVALGEAARLNRLVEDLLQTTRGTTLRRCPSSLAALAQETAEAFRRDQRFTGRVSIAVEAEDFPASVDPDRIRQVMWNLVLNAAQAMPAGGEVDLRVSRPAAGGAEVVVSDRGVGIEPEERSRIFDPFYTRKSGGTGLGLALVDQIVRAHGGAIEVAGREGGGATFKIRLPADG
jgi:two-component system sensor histidine kinase PilS (NtrC family)